MANNIIRQRAARLLREDAGKHILSAATDMDRMGLSNIGSSVIAVRKALVAYDRAMEEADALDRESALLPPQEQTTGADAVSIHPTPETPRMPETMTADDAEYVERLAVCDGNIHDQAFYHRVLATYHALAVAQAERQSAFDDYARLALASDRLLDAFAGKKADA